MTESTAYSLGQQHCEEVTYAEAVRLLGDDAEQATVHAFMAGASDAADGIELERTFLPFALLREPNRQPKPVQFDNRPTRQGKLLSGLGCLPGQRDLFQTE